MLLHYKHMVMGSTSYFDTSLLHHILLLLEVHVTIVYGRPHDLQTIKSTISTIAFLYICILDILINVECFM